jgi:transglutaminase-like putative cysteine protease
LRAAKIPARPVYGVAYTGDGESLFAYHAWVEVALTVPASDPTQPAVERWVAIDPTWGEERADATHLQLGSSLSEVASTLGGLTIESAE